LNLIDTYLLFIGGIADWFLQEFESGVSIQKHEVYVGTEVIAVIDSGYLLKKWTLILLVVFWITPAKVSLKLVYTGLVVFFNPIGSVLYTGLSAHLMAFISNIESARLIGRTPYELLMLFIFVSWIWRNRKNLMHSRIVKKFRLEFFMEKLPQLFIVMFIYVLFSNILLGAFQYRIWINFLFTITAWILNNLGFPALIESQLLVGESGSIYLAKPCLGFNTMLLFASIVYVTGENSRSKWLFILGGIILLNLVNIVRFVLLFIHIQKHGEYVLEIDVHELYNYIIYGIVFILWIIWFEKFSYIGDRGTFGNNICD